MGKKKKVILILFIWKLLLCKNLGSWDNPNLSRMSSGGDSFEIYDLQNGVFHIVWYTNGYRNLTAGFLKRDIKNV